MRIPLRSSLAGEARRVFFLLLCFLLLSLCAGLLYGADSGSGSDSFVAAWISDTHVGFSRANQSLAQFSKDLQALPFPVQLIVHTGDVSEIGAPDALSLYQETISPLAIPAHTLIGNHDVRWSGKGKAPFHEIVGPLYGSATMGGIHWIFLDTSMVHQTHGHLSFEQVRWLKKHLPEVPQDLPLLVLSHHPLRWTGVSTDNGMEIFPLFRGRRVLAFLSGHGHNMRVLWFNGVPFIQNDALFHGRYLLMRREGDHLAVQWRRMGEESTHDLLSLPFPPPPFVIPSLRFPGIVKGKAIPVRSSVPFPPSRMTVQVSGGKESLLSSNPGQAHPPDGWRGQAVLYDEPGGLVKLKVRAYTDQVRDTEGWCWVEPGGGIRLTAGAPPGQSSEAGGTPDHLKLDRPQTQGAGATDLLKAAQPVTAPRRSGGRLHLLWERSLFSEIAASPLVTPSGLLVGTVEGFLCWVGARDGKLMRKISLPGGLYAAPVISQKKLFAGCDDGSLVCLEASGGKKIWSLKGDAPIYGGIGMETGLGILVFSNGEGDLSAVDASSGSLLWKTKLNGFSQGTPLVSGGMVFLGTWGNRFYGVNLEDGKVLWEKEMGKKIYFSPAVASPVMAGETLLVPSKEEILHGLDPSTGEEKWSLSASAGYVTPAVDGEDFITATQDGKVMRVSASDGRVKWETKVPGTFYQSSPLVLQSRVYVTSMEGVLFCLEAGTGHLFWRIRVSKDWVLGTPAIQGGGRASGGRGAVFLYVATMGGEFRGLRVIP